MGRGRGKGNTFRTGLPRLWRIARLSVYSAIVMIGREWIVEAHGCDPAALCDQQRLEDLFDAMVRDLGLRPVCPPVWHAFPGPGGVTGVLLLAESHLACHTFPEHRSICLNLFCCRPREDWDFSTQLAARLGAVTVDVRRVDRPYGGVATATAVAAGSPASSVPSAVVLP